MTDKEKLLDTLNSYEMDSIEAILNCFLMMYGDSISIRRIHGLLKTLNDYLGTLRNILKARCGKMKKLQRCIYNHRLIMHKLLLTLVSYNRCVRWKICL